MKVRQLSKLICTGLISGAFLFGGVSEAGIVTDRLPLQCYADHQVNTYNSPSASKRAGYISANVDLIQITQVRGDGWCYGSYPGAGGKRVSRWFKITDVCADAGYTNRSANVKGKQTVYRTRSGGSTLGSVSNNESVIVVADNGSRAQIVYRLDNGTGYKLGWVPSSSVAAPTPTPAPTQSHNPEGNYEGVESKGANQITVSGWAMDRDDVGKSLRVHVYVGGPAGSGAEGHEITANKSRPDVQNWYSRQGLRTGIYYGFNDTIKVTKTGRQDVYVYAINVGGGSNVELGHKTVNIKGNISSGDVRERLKYAVFHNQSAKISCDFDGYKNTKGRHEGIDLVLAHKAPVYSAISGVITKAGGGSYNTFAIYDKVNNKTVVYLHFASVAKGMYAGRTVQKGELIGYQGNTGAPQGSHVHIEVRNGQRTAAAKSVNDPTLDNPNPYEYWEKVL